MYPDDFYVKFRDRAILMSTPGVSGRLPRGIAWSGDTLRTLGVFGRFPCEIL